MGIGDFGLGNEISTRRRKGSQRRSIGRLSGRWPPGSKRNAMKPACQTNCSIPAGYPIRKSSRTRGPDSEPLGPTPTIRVPRNHMTRKMSEPSEKERPFAIAAPLTPSGGIPNAP